MKRILPNHFEPSSNFEVQSRYPRLNHASGFTLVELMIVIVLVAIFAAIAMPSYQAYALRANAGLAEQEIQRVVNELDRWKSRNFNYLGYNLPTNPVDGYTFEVRDGDNPNRAFTDTNADGRSWVIRAIYRDDTNDSFLITSSGIRCKNKNPNLVTFTGCGTNAGEEQW